MTRERFTTKFFINHNRVNHGEAIVQCRVSFRGKNKTFSTGLKIPVSHWDPHVQRIMKTDGYSKSCNDNLDQIKANLFQARDVLIGQRTYFTVDDMIAYSRGTDDNVRFFVETYEQYIDEHKRPMVKAGKLSLTTLQKHERTVRAMKKYILTKYKKEDVDIRIISHEFLAGFFIFLQTEEKLNNNTAQKNMQRFRELFLHCSGNGWILKDPFVHYKIKFKEVDRQYLSEHELKVVENFNPPSPSLQRMKDIFLFACYTGLAYADIKRLKMPHIHADGSRIGVVINRKKTRVESYIPLLPEALDILNKYSFIPERTIENRALPVLSNQKSNVYVKTIIDLCGINKEITMHSARHTFATYMLTKGVSIESVAKMMGQKDLRSTRIYARILKDRVDSEMDKVKQLRLSVSEERNKAAS